MASVADTALNHYSLTGWGAEISPIGVWGGGGRGGAAALPNSGKTVGKIRAKQEGKIGQRKLKD